MPALAQTYPFNQWSSESFWNRIAADEDQEIRVAVAYQRPIDRKVIRDHVIDAILTYAAPAGNA